MTMPKNNYPTIEEIEQKIREDNYEGFCTNCGDWTHDCCEPDACNYTCPECENDTCYGAEELIVQGMYK